MLSNSKISEFHNSYMPITETGCWIWIGKSSNLFGYGSFTDKKSKLQYAHRASWIIHYGEIPKGMCVCHKCDIASCVNPQHLFLGTHKDNMQDMFKKNRRANTYKAPGEKNAAAKITADNVAEIRNGEESGAFYARKYGVSPTQIMRIRKKISWKHI